jgi:hypothetical protein
MKERDMREQEALPALSENPIAKTCSSTASPFSGISSRLG